MDIDLSAFIDKQRRSFAQIEQELADPNLYGNRQRFQQVSREHQRLSRLLSTYDDLARKRRELADNRELLLAETDPEFRQVIEADIAVLEQAIGRLDSQVLTLILPPSDDESRNTIVEIRPAAGGDEASLFAAELFRMYQHYAERKGWKVELLEYAETGLGGIRDVSFSLQGENVFRHMRRESGVHRVQRVPETETSGRIHTSTVTVAVLPEAQDVDIHIDPNDLRIDVFRSSGPGGQSVNTTDSAVRVTHIPSGLSVASQQEKSQHRNKDVAMRILRARLYEAKRAEEEAKYAAERRQQVGTGDRSERIRTYNFPQNRVTDHRYGMSWHNLPAIVEGDIDEMLETIQAQDMAQRLQAELAKA